MKLRNVWVATTQYYMGEAWGSACVEMSSYHFLVSLWYTSEHPHQKKEGPFSFCMLPNPQNLHQPKHTNHSHHPSRHVPNSLRRDFPRWNVTSWNWMADSAAGWFTNIRIIHQTPSVLDGWEHELFELWMGFSFDWKYVTSMECMWSCN